TLEATCTPRRCDHSGVEAEPITIRELLCAGARHTLAGESQAVANAIRSIDRSPGKYRLILLCEKCHPPDENRFSRSQAQGLRLPLIGATRLDFHFPVVKLDPFAIAKIINKRGRLDVLGGEPGATIGTDVAMINRDECLLLEP